MQERKTAPQGLNGVKLHWLGDDGTRLDGAEVVRLVIDDGFLRQGALPAPKIAAAVSEFLGCRPITVFTPAGFLTAEIPPPDISYDNQQHNLKLLHGGLKALSDSLDRAWLAKTVERQQEWIVGMDGITGPNGPNSSAPLQTVVKLRPDAAITLENAAIKMYPAQTESRVLIGWWLNRYKKVVAPEIMRPIWDTRVGRLLPLVCHEGVVFSGRSIGNLKDRLRMRIRMHLMAQARTQVRYIFFCVHHLGPTMHAFKDAGKYISGEGHATVVTSMYVPPRLLEDISQRNPPFNKRDKGAAAKVVTLIVRREK